MTDKKYMKIRTFRYPDGHIERCESISNRPIPDEMTQEQISRIAGDDAVLIDVQDWDGTPIVERGGQIQ